MHCACLHSRPSNTGSVIRINMGAFQKMNEKLSYVYSNYICRCRKSNLSVSTQMTSTDDFTKKTGFVPTTEQLLEIIAKSGRLQKRRGTDVSMLDDSDTQ